MRKGNTILALILTAAASLSAPAHTQTLEQQERMNHLNKAIGALHNLEQLTRRMTQQKLAQCMIALGSDPICKCLSENIPVAVDFRKYVEIVTRDKVDLHYSALSPDDKKIVDNVRLGRDKCVSAGLH